MGIFNDKSETGAVPADESVLLTKKARQKANDEKRRAARKAGLEALLAFVKGQPDLPENIKQALFDLRPMRNTVGVVRENMQDKLGRLFAGKKHVTGLDVYAFEGTHWGVSDMRRNMILAIKGGEPSKRLWIEYDLQADAYTLVATGATPPEGWKGYVPVEQA